MKNKIITANNLEDIIKSIGEVSLEHYTAEKNEIEKAFYLGMLNVTVALSTIHNKMGGISFDYATVKDEIDTILQKKKEQKEPEVLDNQISMQDYLPELFEKLDKLIKKLDKKKE